MPRLPPVPISPHTRLRARLLSRRDRIGRHLVPVAFQLFRDELGEAGERALSHLGARDANDAGVVGLDDDPGIDLDAGLLRLRRGDVEGKVEAERKAAARGGYGYDEIAPRRRRSFADDCHCHGGPP